MQRAVPLEVKRKSRAIRQLQVLRDGSRRLGVKPAVVIAPVSRLTDRLVGDLAVRPAIVIFRPLKNRLQPSRQLGDFANRLQTPRHLRPSRPTPRVHGRDVLAISSTRGCPSPDRKRCLMRMRGSKGGNPRLNSANGVRPISGHVCTRNENHDGEPRHPRNASINHFQM